MQKAVPPLYGSTALNYALSAGYSFPEPARPRMGRGCGG